MRKSLFYAATVATLVVACPAISRAAEVLIENYSNDPIFVAKAYRNWKGNLAAEGWTKIESNKSYKFKADDASHLHLRVERNGKEVTWKKYDSYLNWPVSHDRFTVSKAPDDSSIRILRWGPSLEKHHNIKKDGKLPNGWEHKRFFHIGNSNLHLHVNP
ncbi:MAG TPA: hypothetical protein VH575_06670 [Gemmataceae bacterium]|jgi:uncharacterized membrane protein